MALSRTVELWLASSAPQALLLSSHRLFSALYHRPHHDLRAGATSDEIILITFIAHFFACILDRLGRNHLVLHFVPFLLVVDWRCFLLRLVLLTGRA